MRPFSEALCQPAIYLPILSWVEARDNMLHILLSRSSRARSWKIRQSHLIDSQIFIYERWTKLRTRLFLVWVNWRKFTVTKMYRLCQFKKLGNGTTGRLFDIYPNLYNAKAFSNSGKCPRGRRAYVRFFPWLIEKKGDEARFRFELFFPLLWQMSVSFRHV